MTARPHNAVAELAVLGLTQIDPEWLPRLSPLLEPEDFYNETHRHIWRAMQLCGSSDPLVVHQHMADAPAGVRSTVLSYLLDAASKVAAAASGDYYAAVIRRCATARSIVDTAATVIREVEALGDGTADAFDEAASDCQSRLARAVEPLLRKRGAAVGHQTWAQTMRDVLEDLEHPKGDASPLGTVTTTFPELDRLAEVPVGQMTVIAARPGVGKSSLATRLVYEYAHLGMRPHLWCLEDSLRHLAIRALSQRSGVETRRVRDIIRHGARSPEWSADQGHVLEHTIALMDTGATWDDTPGRTVEQIRMQARDLVRLGTRILLVDHALRLRLPSQGRDTREKLNHIIGELSEMAAELGVPVIVFTQLKRLDADRPPVLSDLKESGKWEEDARLVLLLHRDGVGGKPNDTPDIPHPAWITVAKANHGAVGAVKLMFDPRRCLWRPPTMAEQRAMAGPSSNAEGPL